MFGGQSSLAQPPDWVFQKAKCGLGTRQLSEDHGKEQHGSPSLTGEAVGVGKVGCRDQGLRRGSPVTESISFMQGRSHLNKHVPGLHGTQHRQVMQAIKSHTGSESPSREEPQLYKVMVLCIHISFSLL